MSLVPVKVVVERVSKDDVHAGPFNQGAVIEVQGINLNSFEHMTFSVIDVASSEIRLIVPISSVIEGRGRIFVQAVEQ